MPATYLATQAEWNRAAAYAQRCKLLGLDSETYGHNVKLTSPAYRASIHVWSIAFLTPELASRGHHVARGAVLPFEALSSFKNVLEDPTVTKVAHNARHDIHSLENHGIRCQGTIDTLDLARLAYPHRSLDHQLGFGLKALARDILGREARDEFNDIVDEQVPVTKKICECGEAGCKLRNPRGAVTHAKREVPTGETTRREMAYPLETIVPGHPRWLRLVEYAAQDAVDALEFHDLATRRLPSVSRSLPW